jgi:tetratricopeptide (TPR) repeat protein
VDDLVEPPERIELEPEDATDRYSRFAAVAIVVATLSGAAAGWLAARADAAADKANAEAQRLAARAGAALARDASQAQIEFEAYVVATLQRQAALNAFRDQSAAQGEDRAQELERMRLDRLADATSVRVRGLEDSPYGARRDPTFPFGLFQASQFDSDRLGGRADAANEEDSAWEAKQAQYAAVLTFLAVAVYLLALSHSLRNRVSFHVRLGVAALGVGLTGIGVVLSLSLSVDSPERAPNEAARAFARGERLLLTAANRHDFRRAVGHLSDAIDARPTFAQAFVERSFAKFSLGTPEAGGESSLTTPRALERANRDLLEADDIGLKTVDVLWNLGWQSFLLGLQGNPDKLLESVDYTRQAVELSPHNPLLRYNLALALLAMGDSAKAHEIYERAVADTIFLDRDRHILRNRPGTESHWASLAINDLELLRSARPELGDEIDEIKQFIVGSVSRGELGTGSEGPVATRVEVEIFPAELTWEATLEGFDPEEDTVWAQWYRLASVEGRAASWAVISEVSGRVAPKATTDGRYFDQIPYLGSTSPPRCVPSGTYRVELFVNGHLSGEGERETGMPWPSLRASDVEDMNLALCRPPSWELVEETRPIFLQGLIAPDKASGAYFLRFHQSQFHVTGRDVQRVLEDVVGRVGGFFPGPPRFHSSGDDRYFAGLTPVHERWYRYTGGQVLAEAGLSTDGAIIVSLVFGPVSPDGDSMLDWVVDSIIESSEFEP